MKWLILGVALTITLPIGVAGQSRLLTDPVFVKEFPSDERLRSLIRGDNPFDTEVRLQAVRVSLINLINKDLRCTGPNVGCAPLPPVMENFLIMNYGKPLETPTANTQDPRFWPLVASYQAQSFWMNSILTTFFSPAFRAEYYAWVKKPNPDGPGPASGRQATAAAAADTSIQKAKAAKVDLGVFGMTLGEPLRIPKCPMDFSTALMMPPPQSCLMDISGGMTGDILNLTELLVPGSKKEIVRPDEYSVRLDKDHCPDWVSQSCQASVLLEDGALAAISVTTRGRGVEKLVNAELREKYGPATRVAVGRITPDVGNVFDTRDPEWILPGLRVEYKMVWHTDTGEVNTSFGRVWVGKESTYLRLFNKPVKKKM